MRQSKTVIAPLRQAAARIAIRALIYLAGGAVGTLGVCKAEGTVPAPGSPPIQAGMPEVHLPRVEQMRLANGLRVLTLPSLDGIPTFTAQLVFRDGGGLYDPVTRRGLATLTAEMLRGGTNAASAEQLAERLARLGATLEASATLDSPTASVTLSGLSNRFPQALGLLAEVVRHPSFPRSQLEHHISVALAALALERADPEFLASQTLAKSIYGDYPAALLAPPESVLRTLRPQELARFHALHYRPDGALLIVVGLSLNEIRPAIEQAFGDWARTQPPDVSLPLMPALPKRAVHLINRPGSVQTILKVGDLGITRTDPDYIALSVMNMLFGGQFSSRLLQNLRERHGYTYAAHSEFSGSLIPGIWDVDTAVRTAVTAPAMHEIWAELEHLRDALVSPTELNDAQRAILGNYLFCLERPEALLQNVLTQALYDLPQNYWERYPQRVRAVSISDVHRVAVRVVDFEHLQVVAVGDAAMIRAGFAAYGTGGQPRSIDGYSR